MKSYFLLIAGVFALTLMSIQTLKIKSKMNEGLGIQFHKGSWGEVLELAKKENKIIFLDISASWCGPCKMLKRKTFTNEKVGELYNKSFVNYEVDGELGEGSELARKYKITGYPTLLFIRADGSIHASTSGYHNPDQFVDLGLNVLSK